MDRSLEIFLRQLYAGTGEVWLAVAYVVCMFGVSAFRPRRIGTPALFRLSYLLFALYLVVPSVAFSILEIKEARAEKGGERKEAEAQLLVASSVVQGVSKALLALTILCGLACVALERDEGEEHPGRTR